MFSRLKNSLLFRLEQAMVHGPAARFAILSLLVVLVATLAGLLALGIAPGFASAADAIWWAFLRLTDPGYLGDDEGVVKAAISTAVTILGYVLFMGALIAILVQWLGETMDRLEQGLTPVTLDAHFVLLGWTSRTLRILEEILVSQERVERFLQQRGARRLRVALLAERADASLGQHMARQLGARWNARQVVLRSGSPLRLEGLERVDFARAGAILIPAADTMESSALDADTRTVKALMTMSAALEAAPPEEPPLVVAELQETRHGGILRALYPGPMEIVAGDEVISRLLAQIVRHPGLSHVYDEFLSDVSGSQIYVREGAQLAGVSVQQLAHSFPEGVLLGVVRPEGDGFQALLNPPDDLRLEPDDRIAAEAISSEHLEIRQLEFDYTVAAFLEPMDPAGYDNLVLLPSERLKSGAESDARTILAYILLRELMQGAENAPPVLVELTDPENVALFENRRGEVIVSPVIISHMLARVALRRELRAVFDELFGSGGSEIFFRRIADYDVPGGECGFSDLLWAADARGEIAIGIRQIGQDDKPGGGVELNPGRDERLRLNEDDEIIVLTTYQ